MIIREENLNTLANVAGTRITGAILDINLKNYEINKRNYEINKKILEINSMILNMDKSVDIENKIDNIIKGQEEIINLLKNIYEKL